MIEIKNRYTGEVIKTVDADSLTYAYLSSANLSHANLSSANLRHADLSHADLSHADLSYADLTGADLTGADLRDADLRGADLRSANLTGADLRGAYLTGAYLTGDDLTDADLTDANLRGAIGLPVAPVVKDIDKAILEAVTMDGQSLDMDRWHTCDTTHCRAGWAIHLAGEAGYALEKELGPSTAGALIYHASAGYVPDFYASDKEAMKELKEKSETAVNRSTES